MSPERTLRDYIQDAKAKATLADGVTPVKSDRQLSLVITGRLNEKPNPDLVSNYTRGGAALPSERVMIELADLGQHDQTEALLDLSRWRAKANGQQNIETIFAALQALYQTFGKKVGAFIPIIILCGAIFAPSPSQGATIAPSEVYIMRQIRVALNAIHRVSRRLLHHILLPLSAPFARGCNLTA